jgi:hypothetical protein
MHLVISSKYALLPPRSALFCRFTTIKEQNTSTLQNKALTTQTHKIVNTHSLYRYVFTHFLADSNFHGHCPGVYKSEQPSTQSIRGSNIWSKKPSPVLLTKTSPVALLAFSEFGIFFRKRKNHSLYNTILYKNAPILKETWGETSYLMVRLVFRHYTQVKRTICTSVSLRASTAR